MCEDFTKRSLYLSITLMLTRPLKLEWWAWRESNPHTCTLSISLEDSKYVLWILSLPLTCIGKVKYNLDRILTYTLRDIYALAIPWNKGVIVSHAAIYNSATRLYGGHGESRTLIFIPFIRLLFRRQG